MQQIWGHKKICCCMNGCGGVWLYKAPHIMFAPRSLREVSTALVFTDYLHYSKQKTSMGLQSGLKKKRIQSRNLIIFFNMEFQTTLQNGKAYSCTPLHSHLDVKQPFQDFTVKKTHLPELHRTSSVNPAIYIYKKEDKGNISPAWDRGGDVRVQPGGMMRHDPPVHCIKPGRSYWLTGYRDAALCATSSDQQHVYLSRRLQNSTWK